MKRHGRILTLVLAVMLAALMLVSVSALEIFIIASSDEYQSFGTSARYLETIEVMQGYGDGELHLEDPILRYQAALFFSRVMTGITNDAIIGDGASEYFSDVHSYGPVIDTIADLGIIRGRGNGTYGYDDRIMYQDMCAMLVRALGYETEEMVKAYPMSYIFAVRDLGLELKNVKGTDYLNRGQTAKMVYDALTTEVSVTRDKDVERINAILEALSGTTLPNPDRDTYLERNFNVSSTMYFEIVATENYNKNNGTYTNADEGYFKAVEYYEDANGKMVERDPATASDEWVFPIEGSATADVGEADLIGKFIAVVFDDKTPTFTELSNEEIKVVHADVVEPVKYENLGELNYVKFDDATPVTKLTLGTKTVTVADLTAYGTEIWQYSTNKDAVCTTIADATALDTLIKANTYFALDTYDINKDGKIDRIVYKPYEFGQYAKRTYSGNTYTMVGKYYDAGVYDTTNTVDRTNENFTNFVEYFLGESLTNASIASKSYDKYTPGDTSLKVTQDIAESSLNVVVSGKEINTGDFMVYYYNKLLNKLEVVENLGTFQLGELSGYRSGAETVTLDGSAVSVGLPGMFADRNNGALMGVSAYATIINNVQNMIINYTKGETNVRYLEYDGKIFFLKPYGGSEIIVGGDYVIVDIEKTFKDYEKSLARPSDAFDIPFEGECAVLTTLNPATGNYETIKVELLTYKDDTANPAVEKSTDFKNWDKKQAMSLWSQKQIYNIFDAEMPLYVFEDEDKDGALELYGYDTAKFTQLLAFAPAKSPDGNGVSVSFNYNKSNEFVADNLVGVGTDRITTGANTVSVIIGNDGYSVVKGELGSDSVKANALYLSANAKILSATDAQLTIFDPGMFVVDCTAPNDNIFNGDSTSVWAAGIPNSNVGTSDGYSYYIMLENSSYLGSSVMENSDGSVAKNDDGDALFKHEYKGLYNLVTKASENVTLITTSINAPATQVINSINGVIRYNASENAADTTTFGDVFVTNGDYAYGGFGRLASKEKISFTVQPKGNEGVKSFSAHADVSGDKIYKTLKTLNITFIDLDEGASVDPDKYSFADAYLFYEDNEGNRKAYSSVTLTDRSEGNGYGSGTFPIKRHMYNGNDHTDVIGNGKITSLTAGKVGLVYDQGFYRWNGWCDYLIPAVNEEGDTVWSYEGSLRVKVTYYAYINYDEDNLAVDAVVVRVGVLSDEIAPTPDWDTTPGDNTPPSEPTPNP